MRKSGIFKGILLIGMLCMLMGCNQKEESREREETGTVTQEVQNTEDEQTQGEAQTTEGEQGFGEVQDTEDEQASGEAQKTEEEQPETETPVYGTMPVIEIETEHHADVTDDEIYTNCTVSMLNCEETWSFTDAAAGIRLRGNSTKMFAKKPYRIKFEEKRQLLGLSEGAHKSWVLLAEANDPSMLRNYMTYRLAEELSGIPYVTDCELVEVYMNGEYIGVYLLAEQTQVDNHRIAIDETGVTDPTITDTGYLLELEADRSRRTAEGKEGEAWFAVTGYAAEESNGMHMMTRTYDEKAAYYVVKSDARSPEQMAYIQQYMIEVYDAVYQEKTKEAVEAYVDLASAVDMYLVQLIANDFDNNYSSMYLYKNAGGKLTFGAPWDYDFAYGNFNGYDKTEDTVYVYHLLRQLGEYDWFREMAQNRFEELSAGENGLFKQMQVTVTEATEQYAEEFEREYATWKDNQTSMGGFGGFGNWEMPEGEGNFGGFGGFGNWEMPEGEGNFGGFGGFGGFGNWEMPEGEGNFEGFGGFGDWELPEGAFGGREGFEMPEWNGNFGDFGGRGNFGFGSSYDTQKEASEALLSWVEERLAWIETFLQRDITQ